jgi:hypothetical protein
MWQTLNIVHPLPSSPCVSYLLSSSIQAFCNIMLLDVRGSPRHFVILTCNIKFLKHILDNLSLLTYNELFSFRAMVINYYKITWLQNCCLWELMLMFNSHSLHIQFCFVLILLLLTLVFAKCFSLMWPSSGYTLVHEVVALLLSSCQW